MHAGLLGEVERLHEHEVLRAILDQGSDVRAFGRFSVAPALSVHASQP